MVRSEWSSDMMNKILGWSASSAEVECSVQAEALARPIAAVPTQASFLTRLISFDPFPVFLQVAGLQDLPRLFLRGVTVKVTFFV